MRILLSTFVFGLASLAWGHGALVTSPYQVASARSKLRARPDFFSVAGPLSINEKNETKLYVTFGTLSEACGRNAEIFQRIDKRLGPTETPSDANAAKIYASLMQKVNGLCASVLEFMFHPWPQKAPGGLAGWARALKKAMGLDYKLFITASALSDTAPDLLKYAEAEAILEHADGLSLYLSEYRPVSGPEYKDVLTKNLLWANAITAKTGKKVILYLAGFNELNWNGVPAFRNLTESIKTVMALKKDQVGGLCTEAVRLALYVPRLEDSKLDREMIQFEKWRTAICATPPVKN